MSLRHRKNRGALSCTSQMDGSSLASLRFASLRDGGGKPQINGFPDHSFCRRMPKSYSWRPDYCFSDSATVATGFEIGFTFCFFTGGALAEVICTCPEEGINDQYDNILSMTSAIVSARSYGQFTKVQCGAWWYTSAVQDLAWFQRSKLVLQRWSYSDMQKHLDFRPGPDTLFS